MDLSASAGFLTKADLARRLRLSYWQVIHAVKNGMIPEPSHRFGSRKWYHESEVAEIKAKIGGAK